MKKGDINIDLGTVYFTEAIIREGGSFEIKIKIYNEDKFKKLSKFVNGMWQNAEIKLKNKHN